MKFWDRTDAHGHLETRVVQALTITDLGVGFPHAVQVAKIVRHRPPRKTGKHSRETVYVITDLTSREATFDRITKIVRSQWIIENRLHLSATPPSLRTPPRSVPDTAPTTWPTSAASPSTHCEPPAARISRPASARCPTTASVDHWTSSAYPDQHSRRIKRRCNNPGGRPTHGAMVRE